MNWLRIATGSLASGSMLLALGAVWANGFDLPSQTAAERSARDLPSRARIVVRFNLPEPLSGPSAKQAPIHAIAASMESQAVISKLLESFEPGELTKIFGAKFWSTADSDFQGLRVTPDEDLDNTVTVEVSHRNPRRAKLIATRLYTTFLQFQLETAKQSQKFAMGYLVQKCQRFRAQRDTAQAALAGAHRSGSASQIENAQKELCLQTSLLCQMEATLKAAPRRRLISPTSEIRSAVVELRGLPTQRLFDFADEVRREAEQQTSVRDLILD